MAWVGIEGDSGEWLYLKDLRRALNPLLVLFSPQKQIGGTPFRGPRSIFPDKRRLNCVQVVEHFILSILGMQNCIYS